MAESITFDILARDRASSTFDKIARSTSTLESRFAKFTATARNVATGLSGAEVGKSVLEAADAFELSRSRLETITKNIGGNFDGMAKQVDAADKQMAAFGYTSAETEGALASLESVTRDPAKALKDLGLAADIARGRNIGLSEATLILQRVETGHISQLAKLGIATKDAAGHTLTQAQALQMLTDLYGGAAANYAGTFAGKQAAVGAELKNTAAQIGVALLPAAVDLANALQHDVLPPLVATAEWFDRNRKTIEPLVKAVLIGVGAWKAYGLAIGAAALITRTFGATATASATKVIAANAAEAASAKATAAAFLSEGAAIGAGMAGGLGRGAGVANALLRGAPRGLAAGALIGGQFVGGRYGNELSAAGAIGMFNPAYGGIAAAGIGAYEGTSALLHKTPVGGAVNYALNRTFQPFGVHFGAAPKQDELANAGPALLAMINAYGGTTANKALDIKGVSRYEAALAGLKAASQSNIALQKEMASALVTTGQAAIKSAAQIEQAAQKNINLSGAQDALREAFQKAAQTAADSGRALSGNSDAALANRDAVRQEANAIFAVIDAMKAHGASAAAQATELGILEKALQINATKTYGDKDAVDALLRSLGLIPQAVSAAATALAALNPVQQALLNSDTPSKGAIQQLNAGVAKAKEQAATTGKQVAESFTAGYSPVVAKGADKAAKSLKDAMDRAKQRMQQDLDQVRSDLDNAKSGLVQFASLANNAARTDSLGASGPPLSLQAYKKQQAQRLEQFARLFGQLRKLGLNVDDLRDFVQAGPDAIPAMQQLLATGRGGIRSENKLEARINRAAASVAQQEVATLDSKLLHNDLTKLPRKIAGDLAKELRHLHIDVNLNEADRKLGARVIAESS